MKRKKLRKFKKRLGRAALITAGAGAAVGGLALAGAAVYTEVMTSVIARRRTTASDTIMQLATGKGSSSIDPVYEGWARDLKNTPTELVEIRSRDRYVLRGHWYPVKKSTRTVILVHGWHSRWNLDFSGIAPYLHTQNCNLLMIEQRAHGESGGNLISYGIQERYDVLSWLEWLEKNHPHKSVYLYGVSMGAATVLMTAGLSLTGRVCGIISDCGYSSPQEIIHLTLSEPLGKMASPTLAAVNANCKVRERFTFKDYTPLMAMEANTTIPCLFIHGADDTFVPASMSEENYNACRAPKDILIVPGADHALSFVVDPVGYKQKLTDFFAAYDGLAVRARREMRK